MASTIAAVSENQPLPDGARLSGFFGATACHGIVVVGAAGSGKTTHLRSWSKTSVIAASNLQAPMPAVLRLSEWTGRLADFARWVVAELGIRRDVSAAQANQWLTVGEIVLLLDGLD